MNFWFTLHAYLRTLWLTRAGQSRASFLRSQDRRYRRWLRRSVPKVNFHSHGTVPPLTDKALVMQRFADFNRAGITAAQGWAAFAASRRIGALTVGASTGTSGNRGLFVISDAERFQWLGVMLAKALPKFWAQRVAVILPMHTALYDSAQQTRLVDLQFYDLSHPPADWLPRLLAHDPGVIVAPPKVLAWLTTQAPLHPHTLYAAAETLDPPDRATIEAHFGLRLGQIYMATEGLLGVTCAQGTLHLAEDVILFEWEKVGDLVAPVISSFTRHEQILQRYRMNDLLRLSTVPCRCGSPLQAVEEVVGRLDDVFRFANALITPDVLRNAVLDADRAIADFRLVQVSEVEVHLTLSESALPEQLAAAMKAVSIVLARYGAFPQITTARAVMEPLPVRKLRRVESRVGRDG